MKLFTFGTDIEERSRVVRTPEPKAPKIGVEVGADGVEGDFTRGVGTGVGAVVGLLAAGYIARKVVGAR
jgi:hypothetical protein